MRNCLSRPKKAMMLTGRIDSRPRWADRRPRIDADLLARISRCCQSGIGCWPIGRAGIGALDRIASKEVDRLKCGLQLVVTHDDSDDSTGCGRGREIAAERGERRETYGRERGGVRDPRRARSAGSGGRPTVGSAAGSETRAERAAASLARWGGGPLLSAGKGAECGSLAEVKRGD
jgi:hypothetical protein